MTLEGQTVQRAGEVSPQGQQSARAAGLGATRCVECGTGFIPRRSDRRFCGGACRASASRKWHDEKICREALCPSLACPHQYPQNVTLRGHGSASSVTAFLSGYGRGRPQTGNWLQERRDGLDIYHQY